MLFLVAGIILAVLIVAFLVAPNGERSRADDWRGTAFAHRGLHGDGAPENSLAAFRRAVEAGYGVELDVRFTRDRALVVLHDNHALRMTGCDRNISDMTLEEVKTLYLAGTKERIPTFDEVLNLIAGQIPILVEIKNGADLKLLTRRTILRLSTYKGPYILESFNPLCLRVIKKAAPAAIRGQLVTMASGYGDTNRVFAFLLSRLLLNAIGRPDFVAYNREMEHSVAIRLQRKVFGTPLAVWTVRGAEEETDPSEMPIFEGYRLRRE